MNIKEVLKYIEAIKGELADVKAKAGSKETYTPKVKKHVDDTIEKILTQSDTLSQESLAIAIDNIIHIVKGNRELTNLPKLKFVVDKLDKLTHEWISSVYGDRTSFDRESEEEKKDKKIKQDEKDRKAKEEEEDKNSKTTKYFKLLKDIGEASVRAQEFLHNYKITGDDDAKKELEQKVADAKEKLPNLERAFKKLKTELSDEMDKEDVKSLLTLVNKVKTTFEPTILNDIVDRVSKKVAKFVMTESEAGLEMILEQFTEETIDEAKKEKKWNFEKKEDSEEEKETSEDDETSKDETEDSEEKPKKKKKAKKEISEAYYDATNWLL
jgi:hypothetical protein